MRYFIVNYITRASGQMDEVVSVSKKTKMRDLQTAAVILDFKDGSVIKSSLNGVTIPKDFIKIRDYYQQHYKSLIEDLEKLHGRREISKPVTDKDAVSS